MKRNPRRLVFFSVCALSAMAGSALWLAVSPSDGAADPVRPSPDYALAAVEGSDAAVGIVAGHAGISATAPVSQLPAGLELWVAAAEYGPEGRGSSPLMNTVVLDYYEGSGPKDLSSLLAYRGLRLQLVFHATPGRQPPDSSVITQDEGGSTNVYLTTSGIPGNATDSYLVNGPKSSVEVRIWNTATGRIPPSSELRPLLLAVGGWLAQQ